MNLSRYFINRPIFASVVSTLIFLAGLVSLFQLPVSEYPDVSPPSVVVTALFPGANPTTIAETVATPLEEQINGVENMLYMNSLASSDGSLSVRVTFAIGTDPDLAQQLVQNRVSQALPRLPDVTRQLGVSVIKSAPDLTMVVHLESPDGRYDALYLRNYATLNIKDQLAKIKGVGEVGLFGSGDYAMRVWLNPDKIAEHDLNASDVIDAIRGQNIQVAAGMIGGAPYGKDTRIQYPINVQGRLKTAEEFGQIIIKNDPNGGTTYLKDVARIELDAQSYTLRSLLNNKQAVGVPIFSAPQANALEISKNVRLTMAELKKQMPDGVEYSIVYDPTVFVQDSIDAVVHTLFEAILLVVLVIIIFLQTWRASIIPLLAVPVSIVGTFFFMDLFGFSINVLSLFGMILAIGIVVDDAIVVVENVERNIAEGKTPHDATIQAMKEVTGPIIATALVLGAVFIPISFISGLTGQFYKQFALTIAIATFISTINSLTLSPALSALLLKPKDHKADFLTTFINLLFGWFFSLFNRFFGHSQHFYARAVGLFTRRALIMMILFAGLVFITGNIFQRVPQGFVPAQDKGYLIGFAQLPAGATLDRTEEVMRAMGDIALKQEGVSDAIQFPGLSINGFINSPSAGIVFVGLKSFKERNRPDLSGFAIAQSLQQKFGSIDKAFIAIFPPPPVPGLGNTGGFSLKIQDRANQGKEALDNVVQAVQQAAWQEPALSNVYSGFNINYPQIFTDIDRTKAQRLGLQMGDVFGTMQTYLGSSYVNDFNAFGRTYQVIAQADAPFRSKPQDIASLKVRNQFGEMIPLGAIATIKESFGPETATRYNGFLAADINGDAGIGFSSGQAQAAITKILKEKLPNGFGFEWTELTYQQILAGNTAIYVFPLCLLLVFLVLAAQYESLMLPIAVIAIIPMAILSAMVGLLWKGMDNNIFTQIALFVLAGLASKNAILIVEFARELEHHGYSITKAAIEACRLRLRPILMTSIAFIMGVLPLVFSHGAGSEMRQAIGNAVFFGMIGVTFFGLIFTPIFYVLVRKLEVKLTKNNAHLKQQNQDKSDA
jgi:multidrug efflux pump